LHSSSQVTGLLRRPKAKGRDTGPLRRRRARVKVSEILHTAESFLHRSYGRCDFNSLAFVLYVQAKAAPYREKAKVMCLLRVRARERFLLLAKARDTTLQERVRARDMARRWSRYAQVSALSS
jgi:hypothetical protein